MAMSYIETKQFGSATVNSKLVKFYTLGVGNTVHTKGCIKKNLKLRVVLIGRAKNGLHVHRRFVFTTKDR